jgi:uncharacterized protein
LGRTDMMVSRIGLGGIPIQRVSEQDAVTVVEKCLDLGITFIDTANGYSTSEERIGKAISGRRQDLVVATKSLARTPDDLRAHLDLSLNRLGVDYIDLYQFHHVSDFKTLDLVVGLLPTLEKARKAGIIRHIGISSHQLDTAKKAVETGLFETVMVPFNFMTPEVATELLPLCRKHDVGFIAMKPMVGGMIDNASIAIKYLLQFPDILIIPGIERVEEIEEILGIYKEPHSMTEADVDKMERLRQDLDSTFCHRCDYCQPCPADVPISTVLFGQSFHKRFSRVRFFEMVSDAMEKAAGCTDCGNCEERCPYHLPIRKMVADQVGWFKEEEKKYREETGC